VKLSALRLHNIKRFADRGIAIEGIGDGVNVLCAANEFGKSTSFDALHALFFQPHTGTPKDIQRLRPYSGGSPLVEADIETENGQFRLTKRYYSGRLARVTDLATGRLLAQADEAENFISEIITGGTAGPAGLLWVRQGLTGLERRSRTEEENEQQIRTELLQSVQGEVVAVTGGRRMEEVMATCSEELSSLVTASGRPRTGSRYAEAITNRDRLAEAEQRLVREVEAFREALDRKAAAAKRLQGITNSGDRQERRAAVEQAETRLEQARSQNERLQTAAATHDLETDRAAAAKAELEAYYEAMAKAQELETRLSLARQTRHQASAHKTTLLREIEAAEAEFNAAEAAEHEARERLKQLETAARAREEREQLEGLRQRLHDAEDLRTQIETGKAELALLELPASAVEELQALDIEIAGHQAAQAATRPTVSVAYEAGVQDAISLDGEPLKNEEECRYNGHATLSIPGIGAVTLSTRQAETDDGALQRLRQTREDLLASMGVPDLATARTRQTNAQRKRTEIEGLEDRIRALAPHGIPELREDVARRCAAAEETAPSEDDPAAVQQALDAAQQCRIEARGRWREAESLRAAAEESYVTAETEVATLQTSLAQINDVLGPEGERNERQATLSQALEIRETALAQARQQVDRLRSTAIDLESAEAAFKRAKSVEHAAETEANTLREEIAGLNGLIHRNSEGAIEEEWQQTREALDAADARVHAFEREVKTLQCLQAALSKARSAARDLYLKPVAQELKPLLNLLFDDVSITFDDETLLPQTILRRGQEEEVDRLSGGMREQLSILTRLAFARLLAHNGRPAPVILDDALVYSDDDRIERMFDALHRQSQDQQIIVFSCCQRAFARLGGNILQMTDWQPTE
jgi:DNA repair exonuclease SbcCD ATPase subunit